MSKKDIETAKTYCMKLLSICARSENEISKRLFSKGYAYCEISLVLAELKEKRFIDDFRFVRQWIDTRLRSKPGSKSFIRAELEGKGIETAVIEEVFTERESELDDNQIAKKIVRIKADEFKYPLSEKDKAKLFRYLLSRGIDIDIAEEVVGGTSG
ncbi:MAG: regulatory protein RecX [Candidatus Omnitrophota bacterium]